MPRRNRSSIMLASLIPATVYAHPGHDAGAHHLSGNDYVSVLIIAGMIVGGAALVSLVRWALIKKTWAS